MRIIYLATGVFDKGGISRYSRYQIRALREILRPTDELQVLSVLSTSANDFEEPFPIDYIGKGQGFIRKIDCCRWLMKTCRAENTDIIWCNHLNFLPIALPTQRIFGIKTVLVNIYGLELWGPRQWVHRHTLPRADVVNSDCHFSAKFVQQRYGIQPEKIRVTWDCVDTSRFRPAIRQDHILRSHNVPVGPQYKYLMTLGRLDANARHKGYDRILDVMAQLSNYPNLIALFGGEGGDRSRLEARVESLGLKNRVFFLGSIAESDLVDAYNLCDLFVLVSDRGFARGEGVPLTPLEAAACAKPIIVGNEDGSMEAVRSGVNGVLVSPRDLESLRAAILQIVSSDDLRIRMGKAARELIEDEFSFERFKERTKCILTDLRKKG